MMSRGNKNNLNLIRFKVKVEDLANRPTTKFQGRGDECCYGPPPVIAKLFFALFGSRKLNRKSSKTLK